MSRTFTLFLLLILVGLLSFVAMPAYADSAPVASYAIYGTWSITGNNNCGGPCVETVTYSFTLDYFVNSTANPLVLVPPAPGARTLACYDNLHTDSCYQALTVGPVLSSSSGPLPIFGGTACCAFDHGYYVGFYNNTTEHSLDEFDLMIGNAIADPALGIPVPFAEHAILYGCQSTACTNDFNGVQTILPDPAVTAEFTATPLPVPEPSTLTLIPMGMLALGLLGAASRKLS